MNLQEALEEAKLVLAGHTRSHVRAARDLAAFLVAEAPKFAASHDAAWAQGHETGKKTGAENERAKFAAVPCISGDDPAGLSLCACCEQLAAAGLPRLRTQ